MYERDLAKKLYRNIKSKIAIVISSGTKKVSFFLEPILEYPCLMKLQAKTRLDISYMDVSKIGVPPEIIHFNRVFHYIHHPFWGTPIFGNTHMVCTKLHSLIGLFPAFTCIYHHSLMPFDILQRKRILANLRLSQKKM